MDLSNENVIYVKHGEIEFLQFKKLNDYPEISHAYVLKNLDFRSHNSNDIIENYLAIFDELNLRIETLLRPHQKHTNNVLTITEKENKDAPDLLLDYLENTDGTVTNTPQITLATTNADCILLLIYDPIKKVIANIHSGWRGTFSKIAEVATKKMINEYGSNPEDIIVCICPSIRKCHFEVDIDVKDECEKIFSYTKRLDEIIQKGEVKDGKQKYYIDTILINKILLSDLGLKDENIIDSGICSVCAHEKIHSRRADGIDYGLGTAIIEIL